MSFLKRFSKAKGRAEHYTELYEEAYRWFQPHKENFSQKQTEGKDLRWYIYDNTAEESLETGASRIQMMVAPYNENWVSFDVDERTKQVIKDNFPEYEKQMSVFLKKYTDQVFEFIHNSNYNQQFNESLKDFLIGTGSMICNETDDDNDPFVFSSIHPSQLFLEEDLDGTPKTVFRERDLQANLIQSLWQNAKLSQKLTEEIKENPTDTKKIKEGVIYDYENKTFKYNVYVGDEKIIDEEFVKSPFMVYRYAKLSQELYGRGPALQSVDDVKILNAAVKGQIVAAEKSVSEVWITSSENHSNMELGKTKQGGLELQDDQLLVVSDVEQFKRLGFDGSASILNDTLINAKQFAIKNRLLAGTVERSDSITRAPEEIQSILQERANDLNAMFSRLDRECLKVMFERVVEILTRRGLLTSLEPILETLAEIGIDPSDASLVLKYESPIAKIKQQKEAQTIINTISNATNIFGYETVSTAYDLEYYASKYAELVEIDPAGLRTPQEVQQMKQQQQEQQMALAQQEAQKNGQQ